MSSFTLSSLSHVVQFAYDDEFEETAKKLAEYLLGISVVFLGSISFWVRVQGE